jgi:hypothetical protein
VQLSSSLGGVATFLNQLTKQLCLQRGWEGGGGGEAAAERFSWVQRSSSLGR